MTSTATKGPKTDNWKQSTCLRLMTNERRSLFLKKLRCALSHCMTKKVKNLSFDTTLLYVLPLERVKGYFLQLGAGFCLAGLLKTARRLVSKRKIPAVGKKYDSCSRYFRTVSHL